jgi:hypothetical protein
MSHTKECERQMAERLAACKEWIKLWPNFCKTCGGAGAIYSMYDPSPTGVSLGSGSMVDVDICSDCAEKGICSRCGEQAWDSDNVEYPCLKCGWDGKESMPPEPECYCDFLDDSEAMFLNEGI